MAKARFLYRSFCAGLNCCVNAPASAACHLRSPRCRNSKAASAESGQLPLTSCHGYQRGAQLLKFCRDRLEAVGNSRLLGARSQTLTQADHCLAFSMQPAHV
jgi:hypothetical protein